MKRKASVSGEFYTYQQLWLYAKDLDMLRGENEGAYDALICSMLLSVAFAVEAHANYLLENTCPNEYHEEREFFSQDPYRGTLGKLCFLGEQLGVTVDRRIRPYQTIKELFAWRDRIVHGRVERIKEKVSYITPDQVEAPEPRLLRAERTAWGKRVFEDTEELCNRLQKAALRKRVKGVYAPKTFTGFLGLRGISLNEA